MMAAAAAAAPAAKKEFYSTNPASFDKNSGHWPAPAAEVQAKAAMAGVATVSCFYLSLS